MECERQMNDTDKISVLLLLVVVLFVLVTVNFLIDFQQKTTDDNLFNLIDKIVTILENRK